MIEFALLFGLGFLSAALAVMLVAPAIHSRIVRYTENRIKATLPISPQEVRAQRDMARAVYAAENARTKQELAQEREKSVSLQLKADHLAEEARRLHSEVADLQTRIDTLDVEAAEARSSLRREQSHVQQIKAGLEASEELLAAKDLEIESLRQRQSLMVSEADNLRIDLSTRDTEVENLKFRITALRDERDTLRADVRLQNTRAKDAETRLSQEENRVQRLEDKLAREVADRADRENVIERRQGEISRLREKLKTANAEAREATRALRATSTTRPDIKLVSQKKKTAAPEDVALRELPYALPSTASPISENAGANPLIADLVADTHNRATALSERLYKADGSNDEAIRRELASIAANMVGLTAASEGPASPIHKILSGKSGNGKRESLAAKSKKALAAVQEPVD